MHKLEKSGGVWAKGPREPIPDIMAQSKAWSSVVQCERETTPLTPAMMFSCSGLR